MISIEKDTAATAPSSPVSSTPRSESPSEQPVMAPLPFTLSELRKAIPAEAFKKSAARSVGFMLFDYGCWMGAYASMRLLLATTFWTNLPFWTQAAISFVYWNIVGFFMWCIFVVGHDCGHKTFSTSTELNEVIGHVTHGSILVPYWPWQRSHNFHHMYHNHIEKDYSYSWYTPEKIAQPECGLARHFHSNFVLKFFFPFYAFTMYLMGAPDGSHFYPETGTRLWSEASAAECYKCLFSSAVVLLNIVIAYYFYGQSFASMAFYYLIPLIFGGWWLVTVTYLQHHHEDSVVYNDSDWSFLQAAFDTVDRTYGFGIDYLHHHITDGHVAHHLFFTQIPHYNLPIATKAIKDFLAARKLEKVYKYEETRDFVYKVHHMLVKVGFMARAAGSPAIHEKKQQ